MTTLLRGRHPGSLTKELDLDRARFLDLIALAAELKKEKVEGRERARLTGKNIALIFEKNSTRTRCAFEVAAHDQGAHVTYLGPEGSHIGRDESIPDTARVLGRLYDGIEFRGFEQETVELLADHAGVPVWNGLTDQWHPTQMLADVLTITEHVDAPIEEVRLCFVGDGRNNVARSLLITSALLGMDVRIAAPKVLQPPADVLRVARELARDSGGRITVTDDPVEGVQGADIVYTDVWVSMGEPSGSWGQRIWLLRDFQVTAALMAHAAPTARFMHCLPSLHDATTSVGSKLYEQYGVRGLEVADEVFESPASVVFDQAENRMHTIKAVMVSALAG